MYKKSSAKYYQENKETLQEKLTKVIKVFLKKKKNEKQQYDRERYQNLSEDEKQKLVEYKKNIIKRKKKLIIIIRTYFHLEKLVFFRIWLIYWAR